MKTIKQKVRGSASGVGKSLTFIKIDRCVWEMLTISPFECRMHCPQRRWIRLKSTAEWLMLFCVWEQGNSNNWDTLIQLSQTFSITHEQNQEKFAVVYHISYNRCIEFILQCQKFYTGSSSSTLIFHLHPI